MKTIFILLLLSGLISCGKNTSSEVVPQREDSRETQTTLTPEDRYLELLNEHRSSLGLDPLIKSPTIMRVAKSHSISMARSRTPFGHSGWKRRCKIISSELSVKSCGEVVAVGQDTPEKVLKAWLNSPPHKAAIENPDFFYTGVAAIKNSSGRVYWTQMFTGL